MSAEAAKQETMDPDTLEFSREEFQGLQGDIGKILEAVKEKGWGALAFGELEGVHHQLVNKRFYGKDYHQVVID